MGDLLQDYKDYYAVRARRYEGNPVFPNAYAAEKALADAMESCSQLEEFKDRMGDLNIKSVIALIKDQAAARKANFLEMKEEVRARAPAEILEKIDSAQNETEAITIVSEIEQKSMPEISVDEFAEIFYDNLKLMEDIECYRKAKVPDKWKDDRKAGRKRDKKALIESFDRCEETARQWKDGWTFEYAMLSEERHRRKIPLPEKVLEKRIEQTKEIREG